MRVPRVLRFPLAVLLGAAAIHVAWSTAMAWSWPSRYPHRMADIRRWPVEVEVRRSTELVSMFLTGAVSPPPPPTTVFFGSSFTYGYPWQEDVIFTTRYAAARPPERVLNVGVLGADLAFIENAILCGATNAGSPVETAVVELQVVLSIDRLARSAFWNFAPPEPCNETIGRVGYWSFVMRHPLGAGWLPFIWDDKASPKPERAFEAGLVHSAFFITREDSMRFELESKLRAQVVAALKRARTIARRVYAFPPPAYFPGVPDPKYEVDPVERLQEAALAACRSVPEVQCLDPKEFYPRRELYRDVTHLNQQGHRVFAGWLAERIR
jgi:hypothetical protein